MRIVRTLAFVGFAISAYLFSMKLTGKITSVVGCGGEGGCADVLGSEWSQWFGIPVSAVSAVFYLGVIGLTFKLSKPLLTMAAILLIGAAVCLWACRYLSSNRLPVVFLDSHGGFCDSGGDSLEGAGEDQTDCCFVPVLLILGLALGRYMDPNLTRMK